MRKSGLSILKIIGLIVFGGIFTTYSQKETPADYEIENQTITVDGEVNDWQSIDSVSVRGKEHLWIGEGLPKGKWKGQQDLSFSWKAAHHKGKLFFLFQVQDDTLSDFDQQFAWLNDCIEIHLDHQNLEGKRIIGIDSTNKLKDRFGKRLRGHEMQFLPSDPPKAFFDDTKNIYYTDTDQNKLFKKEWFGEMSAKKTSEGYLLELGFAIPNFYVQPGQKMGLDIAICDDDGDGRESLMVWSGYQGAFWLTMNNFKKVIIK